MTIIIAVSINLLGVISTVVAPGFT